MYTILCNIFFFFFIYCTNIYILYLYIFTLATIDFHKQRVPRDCSITYRGTRKDYFCLHAMHRYLTCTVWKRMCMCILDKHEFISFRILARAWWTNKKQKQLGVLNELLWKTLKSPRVRRAVRRDTVNYFNYSKK